MRNTLVRVSRVGLIALLLFASLDAADFQPFDPSTSSGSSRARSRDDKLTAVPSTVEGQSAQVTVRQPDRMVRAPRDAHQLSNRTDLTDQFKQQPEIRIIVGLETQQENAQAAIRTNDLMRQQAVVARQTRVLDRVQGLNVRNIKRLRFHAYIAMTVDATALGQLLADPEVTSISEDGVIFPLLVDSVSIARASSAWAEGFRGAGQTIAVIDTGLDSTHPFFAGKVVAEACFSNPGAGSTTFCPNGQPQQ